MLKRLRVEPISSYLERRRKGPVYPVTIANGFIYLSGLPPFDPESGDVKPAGFERQVELVLAQMKHLPGGSRFVAWQCAQMQCLLHAGSNTLRQIQCRLRAIFSERNAGTNLSTRAVVARTVRRRGRLRGSC
jgi:enamine deaminase RidA (YjgF/YER057c/UK114 family)